VASVNGQKSPVDARVAVYRLVVFAVVILAGAYIVKSTLFDTITIKTDQMSPGLLRGDRVVLFKTPFLWPFSWLMKPGRGAPVVVKHPLLLRNLACLRVAGLPGDSMAIGKGIFRIMGSAGIAFGGGVAPGSALLPEFTPRDSMAPYCLPRKGDTLDFDALSLRDFFFAVVMVKQEQPEKNISVKASLTIDGKNANDVPMTNFSLFKGTVNSIPADYAYNWFFWDRLREYWVRASDGKSCQMRFSCYADSARITKYAVHKSFIFLLADDWQKGFDSRYFGPVLAGSIKGRVVGVVWSVRTGGGLFGAVRTDRIMKIVK
jgi:signal peptidase I